MVKFSHFLDDSGCCVEDGLEWVDSGGWEAVVYGVTVVQMWESHSLHDRFEVPSV